MNTPSSGKYWFQHLTGYHWLVFAVATSGWMFDCMDQRLFILARKPALGQLLGGQATLNDDFGKQRIELLLAMPPDERERSLLNQFGLENAGELGARLGAEQIAALLSVPTGGSDAGLAERLGEERVVELRAVVGRDGASAYVNKFSGRATASMIFGWATGGLIFGMLSDKIGRVKTLVITLFFYAGFTGMSALSVASWDFIVYRFLVGLGVGGQFAAAATLVAETMPDHCRAQALGSLQALSAVGNITGSLLARLIAPEFEFMGLLMGWRVLFLIGVLPALLALLMIRHLKEPEKWIEARKAAADGTKKKMGSYIDLFADKRWRKNTIIGVTLAVTGVVGLWGIGFFSPELVDEALKDEPAHVVSNVRSIGTMLQDVGSFFGMFAFMAMATFLGRRQAFFCALLLGMVVTAFVFTNLETASDTYWMLPMLGFATLAIFGGYAIYFPELYPTRLRNTGVGFNYNVGRYLAVPFPMVLMALGAFFTTAFQEGGGIQSFYSSIGLTSGFRASAVTMTLVYAIGMFALLFAPETKGKPLPED